MSGRYTVVIPTLNRRETLLRVLRAVAAQDAPDLLESVIVVDDHSTDGTFEAVGELDLGVPLQVMKSRNRGPSSRNTGFQAARGEYILMLDDDCEPAPNLLREHHRRRRGVDFPHCVRGMVTWPLDVPETPFMRFIDRYYQCGIEDLVGKDEVGFRGFMSGNLSIHRELLLAHGGFDTGFVYGFADTDLGLRLARGGVRILYAPDAVAYHHRSPTLAGYCDRQERMARGAVIFARKHPEHLDVVGLDRLPGTRSLRGIAKAVLVNRLTKPGLAAIASAFDRLGLTRLSAAIYFQILAHHYHAGLRRALADGG